jgi:hypothetical protein
MPKRSYFVPESWYPSDSLIQWAMDEFKVHSGEAFRQARLMHDHEFRRPYSCWDRVFRNWMRKAEELGTLRRERKLRQPEELSEDQRQADILKFKNDPLIRQAKRRQR